MIMPEFSSGLRRAESVFASLAGFYQKFPRAKLSSMLTFLSSVFGRISSRKEIRSAFLDVQVVEANPCVQRPFEGTGRWYCPRCKHYVPVLCGQCLWLGSAHARLSSLSQHFLVFVVSPASRSRVFLVPCGGKCFATAVESFFHED